MFLRHQPDDLGSGQRRLISFDNGAARGSSFGGQATRCNWINNSVFAGPNIFKSVVMAASRIEPGLQILSALQRPK